MAISDAEKLKTLSRESAWHVEYGAHLEPELTVELGERFVVETNDNWWNLLGEEGAVPDTTKPPVGARQYVSGNPVAGPIAGNGVEAGDTRVVGIEEIAVRDWGWTGTIAGFGPLAGRTGWEEVDEPFSTVIRHVPGPSGTLADGEAGRDGGRGGRGA